MASDCGSTHFLAPELTIRDLGGEVVVLDRRLQQVVTASGPAAETLRHIAAGTPVPPRLNDAVSVLTELGVLTPDHHLSRRQLLRTGFAAGAVGITIMALPTAAAAASAQTAPTGVTATAGDTEVSVGWDAMPGATSYTVEYKATGAGDFSVFGSPVAAGPVTVTGLTNNLTYDFRVIASYPAGDSEPSTVVTATPRLPFGRSSAIALADSGDGVSSALALEGFGFFGTWSETGQIITVDLAAMDEENRFALDDAAYVYRVQSALRVGDVGYFAPFQDPAVYKVDLSSSEVLLNFTPSFDGSDDQAIFSACTDGTFGFFATENISDPPGSAQVVKVSLANMQQVGSATVVADSVAILTCFAAGGYGYFGTFVSGGQPGRLVKIDLETMSVAGSLTFPTTPYPTWPISSVTDGTYGYVADVAGLVTKVLLSDMSVVSTVSLNSATPPFGGQPTCATISGGFAFFGSDNSPARVAKVRLSNMTVVGSITLNSGENHLISAVTEDGFGYFGTKTSPGKVVKVSLGP